MIAAKCTKIMWNSYVGKESFYDDFYIVNSESQTMAVFFNGREEFNRSSYCRYLTDSIVYKQVIVNSSTTQCEY